MMGADLQIIADDTLRLFRSEIAFLYLAAAYTTAGMVCAGLCVVRRRWDALLVWLSIFSFLYGVRLGLEMSVVGMALEHVETVDRVRRTID
jgi:phosphoserine phosphatase RsbU/P